ncbi:glycosyltransferase family 4 protein [uncultured Muriicola sp.]|uniref:glycosyltransferase family 4 protein n=1 Tax=uncultured Muriicola sp. TaxID=1583102 RepID=UPI00262F2FBE|nr:glycosyltransferase family 4 protein [uncultured Muriicola sp.]
MKKVLIVTYYWPPAGGPGVQRWLNFIKFLPENGVEPILYIPKDPHYPIKDNSLIKEVPEGLTIYQNAIWEPYKLASLISSNKTSRISSGIIKSKKQSLLERIFLWVRGNFFIPDARTFWVKPSIQFLTDIIDKEQIQTVITSGPPHSLHLIGMGLKQRKAVKWIADFRDPWTSIGYHKELRLTMRSQKKHKALEHNVLNEADEIIVTSKTTKQEFSAITKRPITVITNGFNTDFDGRAELDTDFTISHIGSLLSERNPKVLWRVLSELTKEHPNFKKVLQIQLVGVVSEDVIKDINEHHLGSAVKVLPYLPHEEALKAQQSSQVLLLAEINSEQTKGIIPGKLFEYLAARRPILAIGPAGWEAGDLVRDTGAGMVFTYENEKELKETIWKWFEAYKNKSLVIPVSGIEKFSRKELTKKLAAQL